MKTNQYHLVKCLSVLTLFLSTFANAQNQALHCESLVELNLPDTVITEAIWVDEGELETPAPFGGSAMTKTEVPEFCRVSLTVSPANNMEVWLPSSADWNGRYKAVGGGGLAGTISYSAMIPHIQNHSVTSSTNTGHLSTEFEWLSNPTLLRDYGYRSIHEMTLKSKMLIQAFYHREQDYSYFIGCSTGGRQGLMEAQRYPEDFDGIVSGAAVNYFVANHYTQLWMTEAAKPTGRSIFVESDLELVTKEVLHQCDAIDGVSDGVLENPLACHFDPSPLLCENSDGESCLSEQQVDALVAIYHGPVHGETGEVLHGSAMPGGENPEGFASPWAGMALGEGVFNIPDEYFSRAVFDNPDWDWRSLDFADDIELAYQRTGNMLEATTPNLDPFQSRGGKLITYHGWNDASVFPGSSIDYLEQVIAHQPMTTPEDAPETVSEFMRLFMVPGMAHCSGGPGTTQFDVESAIEAWVEEGIAPDMISASHVSNGQVTRTRPLCPYPEVAVYDGSGSTDNINNFYCAVQE